MLQEILAKINQRERLIGIGAIVLVLGWLFGVLFASVTWKYAGFIGYSANAFTDLAGGTGVGWLALLAAIAAVVVIYLKYAPNMKITWPAPIPVILLALAVVAGVVSLLILLYTFQNMDLGISGSERDLAKAAGVDVPSYPITGWIAVVAMIVGAALMCWGAYQEWTASK
jgi:hypothetical protein